ncbi:hypothetical protein DAPPUDRAFT_110056 [Daphnia pulex]|uniref:Uncharacterized protein n=1 Tax=Daphnia pulex TaxID=6669 RepID=E9H527_DAPPU|nr:hypothetical protein DAPPUDRAFT_110056 [Daphnia pulex]|eukprot:EFX73250.1 hypothetical protein DAPPUDRAFT_110056 [Daphnia pulex]
MYDFSLINMFEGNSKEKKLFFIFCASENPTNSSQEISQHVLFRYLLGEDSHSFIKEMFQEQLLQNLTESELESKITQVETHRQRGTNINQIDSTKPCVDIFVVFKAASENDGESWWTLEKTAKDAVVLQRSRHKDSVKNKLKGETRKGTQLIAEELEGKGCMRQLLTLLWIHMIVAVKYQRHLSRCESLIPLVMKKITKMRYEYVNDFTYSALSAEERNPDLSDIINFLSNKNTYGLRQEIIDRVKEIDDGVIKEYNVLKLTKSEMQISFRKSFVWDLHDAFRNAGKWHYSIQPLAAAICCHLLPMVAVWKLKLFYVPFADLKPGKGSEISESVLVRYIADRRHFAKSEMSNPTKLETCDNIFGDLDPYSQVAQVQIYQVSNNSVPNLIRDRCIVVFKTTSDKDGQHWWSLDKNADQITLQRSRDKDAVINKSKGKARKDLKCNIQDLVGKGSIKKLLTILWIHQVMEEFNPNKSSNRQSFVNFVRKPINDIECESNLAHQSDGKPREWRAMAPKE